MGALLGAWAAHNGLLFLMAGILIWLLTVRVVERSPRAAGLVISRRIVSNYEKRREQACLELLWEVQQMGYEVTVKKPAVDA